MLLWIARPGFFIFMKVEMLYLSSFSHTHKVREMLSLKNTLLHNNLFSCSTGSRQNIRLWDSRLECLVLERNYLFSLNVVKFSAVCLMIKVISSLTLGAKGVWVAYLLCCTTKTMWMAGTQSKRTRKITIVKKCLSLLNYML